MSEFLSNGLKRKFSVRPIKSELIVAHWLFNALKIFISLSIFQSRRRVKTVKRLGKLLLFVFPIFMHSRVIQVFKMFSELDFCFGMNEKKNEKNETSVCKRMAISWSLDHNIQKGVWLRLHLSNFIKLNWKFVHQGSSDVIKFKFSLTKTFFAPPKKTGMKDEKRY